MRYLVLLISIFILTNFAQAHDGIFIRFSLGPGLMYENSSINELGFILPAKNHALGYGFKEKYALYISDFGGLVHKKVGEYNYINLDAVGLGFTSYISSNISLSFSVAQGEVAFAKKWTEATGKDKEKGIALGLSADKEWIVSKHFSFCLSTVSSFFKTKKYEFSTFSINCSLLFYLTTLD